MNNELKAEIGNSNHSNEPVQPVVRIIAQVISFVFHPIFICSYLFAFLLFLHPSAFTGFESRIKVFRFLTVFISTLFLPVFSMFLIWKLKLFVSNIYMRTSRERILPYLIAMIFYWWAWRVFDNLPDSPPIVVHFLLGTFLGICGAWFCNIFFTISMHAIAMGGVVMFFLLYSFNDSYASGLYLSVAFIIAGLVCTSRLLVSHHTPFEIYAGLAVGIIAQLIGWYY